MYRRLLTIILLIGCMIKANAQLTASATATVSATIISPIGTTKLEDLSFGRFSTNSKSGSIALEDGGTLKVSGGIKLSENKETGEPAIFSITGDAGSYHISLQPEPIILKRKDGSETMKVSSFTISSSSKAKGNTITETLAIGATLNVGASQAEGRYVTNTPFAVTVHFN
jgi:hypothetical protein